MRSAFLPSQTPKYHNKKVRDGDEVFDSKREHSRWCELKLLQQAGEITDLRRQVEYELIPAQYENPSGKTPRERGRCVERKCSYKADFVYQERTHGATEENGRIVFSDGWKTVVEDSKGMRTPEYRIKRKLMLFLKGIQIRETK